MVVVENFKNNKNQMNMFKEDILFNKNHNYQVYMKI